MLELFAQLLEYPHAGLAGTARECSALIVQENAEAAALLEQFAKFVERSPYNILEEVFTATFDLNANRHPYIGYHLFGEAYKRSVFMLELRDRYRKYGFDHGAELADHVSIILRFMSLCPDQTVVGELARDAIIISLDPMILPGELEPNLDEGEEGPPPMFDVGDDYSRVLRALKLILEARFGAPSEIEVIPIPDQSRLVS
ncbi:MAG: nitrate reductase molybdenum cofactor assembly chaperone [Vulcanimicrobiaceae bacterium]